MTDQGENYHLAGTCLIPNLLRPEKEDVSVACRTSDSTFTVEIRGIGEKGKWGEGQVAWSSRAANSRGDKMSITIKTMVFCVQNILNY